MPKRFNHLLVPLDFTKKNSAALEVAQEMAVGGEARVTLMHVIETIDYLADEELSTFFDSLRKSAARAMAERAKPLIDAGVPVIERIAVGKPMAEIVAEAHSGDVDLVIMSSHRIEFETAGRDWATLSYQVSVLCPCPVLLVK